MAKETHLPLRVMVREHAGFEIGDGELRIVQRAAAAIDQLAGLPQADRVFRAAAKGRSMFAAPGCASTNPTRAIG